MKTTTTLAAQRDEAIQLARDAAAAVAQAVRTGADPERVAQLRAVSKEAERRVGLLTS